MPDLHGIRLSTGVPADGAVSDTAAEHIRLLSKKLFIQSRRHHGDGEKSFSIPTCLLWIAHALYNLHSTRVMTLYLRLGTVIFPHYSCTRVLLHVHCSPAQFTHFKISLRASVCRGLTFWILQDVHRHFLTDAPVSWLIAHEKCARGADGGTQNNMWCEGITHCCHVSVCSTFSSYAESGAPTFVGCGTSSRVETTVLCCQS